MSLKEQILNDQKTALKEKNELLLSTLRLLNAAIKNAEIEKRAKKPDQPELTDEEIIQVISRQVKQRQDSISEYEKGGRQDLAEKEKQEMAILQKYLPEQLSEEKITETVEKIIKEMQATPADFGKVMKNVMAKLKGKAQGDVVSKIVKEKLG